MTTWHSFSPDHGLLEFYATPEWQEGQCAFLRKKSTTGVYLTVRGPRGDSPQSVGLARVGEV